MSSSKGSGSGTNGRGTEANPWASAAKGGGSGAGGRSERRWRGELEVRAVVGPLPAGAPAVMSLARRTRASSAMRAADSPSGSPGSIDDLPRFGSMDDLVRFGSGGACRTGSGGGAAVCWAGVRDAPAAGSSACRGLAACGAPERASPPGVCPDCSRPAWDGLSSVWEPCSPVGVSRTKTAVNRAVRIGLTLTKGWSASSRPVSDSRPNQEPTRSRAMETCGSSASSGSMTCRAGRMSPMAAAGQCSIASSARRSPRASGPSTASTRLTGTARHQASGSVGTSRNCENAVASLQRSGGTRSLRQKFIPFPLR